MRLAVLGAGGRTGRLVVDQAVELGHQVRALVRGTGQLPRLSGVEFVQGDATQAAAVRRLLEGCDAAVGALGATAGGPAVCSAATAHVLAAMKDLGVRRYLCVGGAGLVLPGKVASRLVRTLARTVVDDREKEAELLLASDLDWVLARPSRLVDGPAGEVQASLRAAPGAQLPRVDLAAFLLAQLSDDRFLRRAPFVASR